MSEGLLYNLFFLGLALPFVILLIYTLAGGLRDKSWLLRNPWLIGIFAAWITLGRLFDLYLAVPTGDIYRIMFDALTLIIIISSTYSLLKRAKLHTHKRKHTSSTS